MTTPGPTRRPGWADLSAATVGPSPSEGGGLVYDAADHLFLLFGGYQNVGGSWLFNGTEIYYDQLWSFAPPPTPPGLAITSLIATPSFLTLGNSTVISAMIQSPSPATFSYSGLPTGCASANASVLDCTPIALGNYTVTLTVSDTQSQSTLATVAISVAADSSIGNTTPILVILSLRATATTVTVGNTTTIYASVVSTNPVTFAYTGLPTGCLSANTDILRCTPIAPGAFTVQLTVTDTLGQVAVAAIAITVTLPTTVHTQPPSTGLGALLSGPTEYLLIGVVVGASVLGALALSAMSVHARYRREGEALAREMVAPGAPGEDPPHP